MGNSAPEPNNSSLAGDNLSDSVDSATFVEDDVINCASVQIIFSLLYTAIFVVGVVGNVVVVYVVARNRAMQTVTNLFIANLALSDILLCVLGVPFTPSYSFLGKWVFGTVLCHLVSGSQGVSVYVSTLTLTSIAVDRFLVILYPFRPRMLVTTCLATILSIWIFALGATLPYGVFMVMANLNGTLYCEEDWPSEGGRQVFGAVTTTLQFGVPLLIITLAYSKVSLRLSRQANARPGMRSSRAEEMERQRKKRTNGMLIAMVAIFGLCWLPLNLINLLNDVYATLGLWPYYKLVFFTAHAVAMSSTCYNVFLYAWLNESFRKEFATLWLLSCLFGGAGHGSVTATASLPAHNGNKAHLASKKEPALVARPPTTQANGSQAPASGGILRISQKRRDTEEMELTLQGTPPTTTFATLGELAASCPQCAVPTKPRPLEGFHELPTSPLLKEEFREFSDV